MLLKRRNTGATDDSPRSSVRGPVICDHCEQRKHSVDMDKAVKAYENVQESYSHMIKFLTVLATEEDESKYYEAMLETKEQLPRFILSLGFTMNGLLASKAAGEDTTLLEQIQQLAIMHECFTIEDALAYWDKLEN